VIISNLQYIESVTETGVQGGRWSPRPPKPQAPKPAYFDPTFGFDPSTYNAAGAEAASQAFGSSTITSTTTDTLAIQGQFSGSYSSSFAEAS
jgi:hypothetical protein